LSEAESSKADQAQSVCCIADRAQTTQSSAFREENVRIARKLRHGQPAPWGGASIAGAGKRLRRKMERSFHFTAQASHKMFRSPASSPADLARHERHAG
jgi:hypothetical protein